jgi:hypothetical protein
MDDDGIGDNSDAFPKDPSRWKIEDKTPDNKDSDEDDINWLLIIGFVIIIVVAIVLAFMFSRKSKKVKVSPEETKITTPVKTLINKDMKFYGSYENQYKSLYGETP